MKRYYIVKKDGKEFRCETSAGAYEMYDCLGRFEVTIEEHIIDDPTGVMRHYTHTAHKATRKKLKSGAYKYYFKFAEYSAQPYKAEA